MGDEVVEYNGMRWVPWQNDSAVERWSLSEEGTRFPK